MKRVVREKWDGVKGIRSQRVRWTVGGDRISCPFDVGTNTAALPTVNALFHACVSENAHFATIDIKDFYLGAELPSPESIRVFLDHTPPPLLDELGIAPFIQYQSSRPFCFFDLSKTVPGLPQSGHFSQLELLELLQSHGYSQTSTPMLFRHSHLPISFTLVVDDFGIKYDSPSDLDHLLSCLSSKYVLKTHRTGTKYKYLGYTIDYDRAARLLTLSMPDYIPNLLAQRCPSGIRRFPSPPIQPTPPFGRPPPFLKASNTNFEGNI